MLLLAGAVLFWFISAALSLFLFLPSAAVAESVLADRPAARAWLWVAVSVLPPIAGLGAAGWVAHDAVARAGMWSAMAHPGYHLCFAGLNLGPDAEWRVRVAGLAALAMLAAGPLRALAAVGHSTYLGWLLKQAATPVPELGIYLLELAPPSSYCHGFLRQRVYVTAGLVSLLSAKELEVVIAHEKAHLGRHDNLVGLAMSLLVMPLVLVPTSHYYQRGWRRSAEMAADRMACKRVGDEAALADALVRTARVAGTGATRQGGLRATLVERLREEFVAKRAAQLLSAAEEEREGKRSHAAVAAGGIAIGLIALLALGWVAMWRGLWPTLHCLFEQLAAPLK